MTAEHEELFDEDLAITSSVGWAMSDRSIDWPQVARAADSFAENLTLLNGHRRRTVRTALLQAHGRTVAEKPSDAGQGVSAAKAAESTTSDLARLLQLVSG